jgi:hypothetical protein
MKLTKILLFLLASFILSSFSPAPSKISLKMEAKMLNKGKAMTINAEIYYQFDQGKMLTRYLQPLDYMFFTNNKGEAKVYYPATNEVMTRQSAEFDSEKGLLYFFLSNKLSDLGLGEMGFKITDTRFEDGLVVSTYFPPNELLNYYSKVQLVHESYKPIYIAWYGPKEKLIKKIYYYEYTSYADFALPLKVVEIGYAGNGDSTITKMTYSQVKTGASANSSFFNFKIPVNAKVKKL